MADLLQCISFRDYDAKLTGFALTKEGRKSRNPPMQKPDAF